MKAKLFTAAVALLALCLAASAQPAQKHDPSQSKEIVKADKIGHISTRLRLTADEAKAFWPIYEEAEQLRIDARKKVNEARKAIREANKEGAATKAQLKAYLAAKDELAAIDSKYADKFLKVLPESKVAKLYLVEESYQKQQMRKRIERQVKKKMAAEAGQPEGRRHEGRKADAPKPAAE